jgi:hypothetical protein
MGNLWNKVNLLQKKEKIYERKKSPKWKKLSALLEEKCEEAKSDVDPVTRMESFRALKLSRLESFRLLKS